jgi:hypothetical protein
MSVIAGFVDLQEAKQADYMVRNTPGDLKKCRQETNYAYFTSYCTERK